MGLGAAAVLAGLTGLLVGSFLNTFIDRWPRGESVLAPPSRCEHCGRRLGPLELVPVLSWIFLRGRCLRCGAAIGLQAPVVEGATGLLFATVAATARTPAELWLGLGLVAVLVAVTGTDLKEQLIPDVALLAGLAWALVLLLAGLTAWGPWLYTGWPAQGNEGPAALGTGRGERWSGDPGVARLPDLGAGPGAETGGTGIRAVASGPAAAAGHPWRVAVLGAWGTSLTAAVGAGLALGLVRWASRGGLGPGDVKLAAFLGLYLGPRATLVALFAAAVLGGIVAGFLLMTGRRARDDAIPFGPFLAAGGLAGWFWGDALAAAYLRWAGLA